MLKTIRTWTRTHLHKVVDSIAFYPALMVLLYISVATSMIWFDLSGPGVKLKGNLGWMSLTDASAARAIISTIAGGIITLTVFSFSMVMIVLNQAASQLSNRLLDRMIGNRFQQLVLGAYIGTIVYALLLLSTIREHDTGSSVPALSTYLLILAAIVDIILGLSRSLGLEVIAEGVETTEQRALLARAGCELYQGYLFSKALPEPELDAFLSASPQSHPQG